MSRTWSSLVLPYIQKLRSTIWLRIESMNAFIKRPILANVWSYVIKGGCFWFFLSKLISEPLNCWPEKLEREWYFFNFERTVVNLVLTWSWVFCFEENLIALALSCGFVKICFVVKRLEVCPDCCWLKCPWRLWVLASYLTKIELIFTRSNICSFIQRKTFCLILTPYSTG